MKSSTMFSTFASLALAACDGRPAREKFPGHNGEQTDISQSQMQKAVLGGFDPLNNPISGTGPGMGGGDGVESNVKPEESIHGTIELGRKVRLRERMLLYIAARGPGGGTPIAVKRLPRPEFPYEFTLSKNDAIMMANAPFMRKQMEAEAAESGAKSEDMSKFAGDRFKGQLDLKVLLDQDGDPLTHQAGDYFANAHVKVGDQNVKIVIDKEAVPGTGE
jgi:hypothetical protein